MIKVGDLLKETRESKSISLQQASEATKISQKLLKALEEGDYTVFASEVFLKGFLKNYARYLGIDVQKAFAIYRRDKGEIKKDDHVLKDAQRPLAEPKPIITPGRLVFLITAFIVIGLIIFVAIQASKIIQPPSLELIAPVNAVAPGDAFVEVDSETITLSGNVEVGSKLLVNGNEVTTNNLQEFNIDNFKLNTGSNEISIVAESYYFSKSSEIKLVVLYEPKQKKKINNEDDTTQQKDADVKKDTVKSMKISIEVGPEEAWIQATVDGETRISNVVFAGTNFSFTASEQFSISTPRPQMVVLTINDIEYELNAQQPSTFILNKGKVIQADTGI